MTASTSPKVVYDPWDPNLLRDPYPIYREMRAHHPLYHNEERGIWALSRYADVKAAASDWQTFSSHDSVDLDQGTKFFGDGAFVDLAPPEHTQIRRLVRDVFTPKFVRAQEPVLRARAAKLMREFLERGGPVDIAQEYSRGLPIHIIAHIIGMPDSDIDMMGRLLDDFTSRDESDTMTLPQRAIDAAREIRDYFHEQAEDRRRSPREDLITHLATTTLPDRDLREDEVTGLCFFLFIAGVDNLAGVITNTIALLAEHPDQRSLLIAEPDRVTNAIEESMRFDPPLQMMARTAMREVHYYDSAIPEGGRVVIIWGSANRDENEWERSEEFDVTRPPKRQLGFGEGIHFCIGAPLARLQTTVAVQTLLEHAPDYAVEGHTERVLKSNIRTYEHLPLNLRPSS